MAKLSCPGIRTDINFAGFARVGACYLLVRGICPLPDETVCPVALLPEQFPRLIAGGDALPYPGTRAEEAQ